MFGRQTILLYFMLLSQPTLYHTSRNSISSRIDRNFTQQVKYDGYISETHRVVTSDGYILQLFRVRTRKKCSELIDKEPIVFSHGAYLSGDDCVIPGPQAAHCYLYADACYDVWVLNMRGSRYSRSHVTLDPNKDANYWNFAFDEMALNDLPASIDYILEKTGQKQIVFIGHSQGTAILMLLCVKKTEYNEKIKIGFGLSPTAFFSHPRFVVVEIEKILSHFLPLMDKTNTNFELFGHGNFIQKIAREVCALSKFSYPICSAIIFAFMGYNRFHITSDVLPVVFGHIPAGISAKNFLRWGQIARNGFSEYDYGEKGNLEIYGVKKPPLYDLRRVTMRWILICSVNDYLADLKDVNLTQSRLPNAQVCVLSDRSIGHLDFVYGTSIAEYIAPMILSFLDKNKFVCL